MTVPDYETDDRLLTPAEFLTVAVKLITEDGFDAADVVRTLVDGQARYDVPGTLTEWRRAFAAIDLLGNPSPENLRYMARATLPTTPGADADAAFATIERAFDPPTGADVGRWTRWALMAVPSGRTPQFICLVLGMGWDDDGRSPTMPELVRRTSLTERTVRHHLRSLVWQGVLVEDEAGWRFVTPVAPGPIGS